MPFSGGTYTKWNNGTGGWAGDAAAGTGITASRHDSQDDDFATAINQCLTKNGANTPTANLPMGGYKHTNVADATAATEYATLGQIEQGVTVKTAGTNGPSVNIQNFNSGNIQPRLGFFKSRGGTVGANTIVQNGDFVGEIDFWAANGSGYNVCAGIAAVIAGTPGASNDMPGRLEFYTTSDGSGSFNERMRINSNGAVDIYNTLNVGDGTGSKSLLVNGANTGTGAGGWVGAQTGGLTRVGIGNYSALLGGAFDNTPTLYFGAAPRVTNLPGDPGTNTMKWHTGTEAWSYDTSSARYKDNIVDSPYGLDAVLAMKSRFFNYKSSGRPDVGFIAEEMVDVVPELVQKNKDNEPDSVSYDRLTAVLCKAIQELTARVKTLEEKIDATNSEGE